MPKATNYEAMSRAQLLKANARLMAGRAKAEAAAKAEQSKVQAVLDRLDAKERADRLVGGLTPEQRDALLDALKAGKN